jgi:D-inositol-3-phosphate glycosyltransferase
VADLVRATAGAGIDARVVSFDRVLVRGRLETRDAVMATARAAYQRVATPGALFVVPSTGAAGVAVARLPVVRRPGSGDAPGLIEDHLVALRAFVDRLVGEWRPDVIHAHTGLPDGIVAAQVGRELGIPVVVSEHASTIEAELADPEALARYRTLLEPGVRLMAVSPAVAERVAGLLGADPGAIGVIPNPVDDASFPAGDPAHRDPAELLWVGSLGEHKGIEVLLRAVAQLRASHRELHLRLVGGERAEGDIGRWRALANELGTGDAITFVGRLDRPDVAAAMDRAGLFVHPSRSETFGIVAAEAILSGLPVAARRSGGVPWILELSGGFGVVAQGDDVAAFAATIDAALDDRFAVSPQEARARLVASVGTAAVAERMLACYREVAGRSEAQPPVSGHVASAPSTPTESLVGAGTSLPRVLIATEREQSLPRVAELPAGLRERIVLVVPPRSDGVSNGPDGSDPGGVQLVEAAPARYEGPPSGRSPIARLRRATWRPPPTSAEELALALRRALAMAADASALDVVALDAPAAALVAELDPGRIRLAPGSLRWLADRWEAETATAAL